MSADRNLLFGILALQMEFITRDQLVSAMNAWVLEKCKPLSDVFVAQQVLSAERQQLLEALVAEHLKQHGNDPQKSLAVLSSASDLRKRLQAVPDPDVQASIICIGIDYEKTRTHAPSPSDDREGVRYRILRPHARGGLGEVFVAQDAELNREVALKEIQSGKDHGDNRARFLLEAEITGGLEHPGIVPVYGLGHYADGRPYYAMRFIKGDNLSEAIKRFHGLASVEASALREVENQNHVGPTARRSPDFNSLEFRRLLQRYIDVCNAVAYAHSRGVLHRDLKPGNIMLGKYGETLVVDWGLAKVGASRERERPEAYGETSLRPTSGSDLVPTIHGSALGTPAYMSPEQAEGRLNLLGPASDVYSLGATLYHLLVGKPANADCDVMEMLIRCQRGEIPALRSLNSAIPKALAAVCIKAMALKPTDRYPSTQSLAADIENWLADDPVRAWREPLGVRTWRWMRKHRTAVAVAVVLLFSSAISLGVLFAQSEKAREVIAAERDRADVQKQIAQAVLDFVESKIFVAARPENEQGGLGYQVTLRKAVEAALPHVESSFADQPLIEARLRMTLGKSFACLGDTKIAAEQFQAARTLYTQHLGPNHPDTLHSMNDLANSYDLLERTDDAFKLREETLALRRANLGPDHPDTLQSMNNLANSYEVHARSADALKLREETLVLRRAKLGPNHPDTLESMNNLAVSYAALGRHADALKLLEETVELMKVKLGPSHAGTLVSTLGLADSYAALGRHVDSLKLREEVLAQRRAKLGPEHAETLYVMEIIANSNVVLGHQTDALKLAEESLAILKAKLGPDHPKTLSQMSIAASRYADLGRLSEALALCEQTLKLCKAKLGPSHPDTLGFTYAIACTRALMINKAEDSGKQADLAMEWLKQAVDAGFKNVDHIRNDNDLDPLRERQDFNVLMLPLYEKTLNLRKVNLGPDHPDTLVSMMAVADCYAILGRHPDALAMREEALKLRRATLGPSHPDTVTTIYDIARVHALMIAKAKVHGKQADVAMKWVKQAVAAGFRNVEHMKKDKDLHSLREREDFKALMKELEAKVAETKPADGAKPGP